MAQAAPVDHAAAPRSRAAAGSFSSAKNADGTPIGPATSASLAERSAHGVDDAPATSASLAERSAHGVDDAPATSASVAAPPPVTVVSFDEVLARASSRNPAAAVAAEEIARARAVVVEARAAALPSLSANGVYTRLDHDRVLNGNVISAADQVNVNLQLSVPLVAPSRWVVWRHARDAVAVAKGSAAEVQRQLVTATAHTYLSLMTQHRIMEVSVRARDNARAHYRFAHQRYAGGLGTRIDEVRAAQELATDEAQLQARVAELLRLREALGVLAGSDQPLDVTAEVRLPEVVPVARAERDAVHRRADVRLTRQELEVSERLAKEAWADYLPALVGSFQPFFQTPPTLTLPRWGWQATLALSWNLFDGGARYGLHQQQRVSAREAALRLQGEERQARADVRAAADARARAAAAWQSAQEAARLAKEGLALSNLAYRGGASTNIEVIDAERRARDAETAAALAEDSWRQATLDLLLASGRLPASR